MHTELLNHLSFSDLKEMMDLSHQSLNCQTEIQFKNLILDLTGLVPFENAVCAQAKIPDAFLNPDVDVNMLDVSHPEGYVDLYFEKNFHLTDVVLCEFLTNLSPVNWLSLDRLYGYNYPSSVYAIDFNMREGWTHGVVDPASMTFTTFFMGGPQTDNSPRSYRILEYIIPFYAEAFKRVSGSISNNGFALTTREIEVLNWIKEGKSSWDISAILNCSKRVVDFHVNNLKKKLNAVSRAQAVAVGLNAGIINF